MQTKKKKSGTAAIVIGWILTVFCILSTIGTIKTGGLSTPVGGIYGVSYYVGFFLPYFLAVLLLLVGYSRRSSYKADAAASAGDSAPVDTSVEQGAEK